MGRIDLDWDTLVRLHGPRLRRCVAKRVPDPAIVDDVVQETFIQAIRRSSTFDRRRALWPWLVGIAANKAWRWSQATQRAAEVEEDLPEVGEEPLLDYLDAGSDDHVTNLHRRIAMRQALDSMTEKHRRILLAWELGDRSVADLAAAEEMTAEELRATVVRARRSLRRRYLAVAGDGVFGWVAIGLGGVVARWRERFARMTYAGWTEAASSLAAAPAFAVVGMAAMITLVPAPPSQAPPPSTIAEQPIALVHDAPAAAAPATDAVAVVSTPSATAVSSSPAPTAAAAPPTLAAGPAAANVAKGRAANSTDLTVSGPNGGTRSRERNEINCDHSVVGSTVCSVAELTSALP